MKIRMLSTSAGPNGVRFPGSEHTVSDAEGKALVDGGYAVALDAPAKPKKDKEPEKKEPEKKDGNDTQNPPS